MGIAGLLPFLKDATRQTNIKEFKGCTVGVDSYCWLHRGAFACADKLALGEPTDQYVYYCMKYVNSLLSMGIRPIMVFDGGHLPSKKDVEKQRRERRETNRKKAAQLLREGKRSEARDALQKCVDINSHMAVQLMKACRDKGVDCIVAPYEADAQLAYLNKIGIADVIITEDSDLILFGCDKIMYKMDFAGNGVLLERENLNKAMGLKSDVYTFEKFRTMCILSGCDYLESLPGIGLKKAARVFQRTRQTDMNLVLKKLPTTLNMSNLTVPIDYIEGYFKAENTFLYQLVYDPIKRQLVPLNPYPDDMDQSQLLYAGPPIDPDKAEQLALGNLDVNTGKRIFDFDPQNFQPGKRWDPVKERGSRDMLCNLSIWDKNYRPRSKMNLVTPKESHSAVAFDISRGRTAGKTVEVSLKLPNISKRKSPIKRHRNDDSSLSHAKLAELYTDTATDEPPEKKAKIDSVKFVKKTQTSSIFHDMDEGNDVLKTESKQRSSTPSPEDGLSLHVSPQSTKEIKDCAISSESYSSSPSPSKRPSVNVFKALGSSSKKRFSLNATKPEVTSRFFSMKNKPFKKSEFFGELAKPHKDKSIKLQGDDVESEPDSEIENELNTNSTSCDELTVGSNNKNTVIMGGCDNTDKSMNSIASNKNKLSAFKSSFDRHPKGSSSCSQYSTSSSNAEFIPVAPSQSCISVEQSAKHNLSYENALKESEEIDDITSFAQSSQPSASQRSIGLWSIDSESFGYSQNIQDGETNGETLSQNEGNNHDLRSFSERNDKPCNEEELKDKNKSTLKSGSISLGKLSVKPGCRSSGLSKKSRKGASTKENSPKDQKSITNFFSKFGFNKNSKEKMFADRKPLSPKKDN